SLLSPSPIASLIMIVAGLTARSGQRFLAPFPGGDKSGRRFATSKRMGQTMIELERPADLAQYVGKEIGVSEWFTVDQALIDKFADATGDNQWIHVDVERAKREM